MTQESLADLSEKITEDSARAIGALRANLSNLPDESIEDAGLLLSRRAALMQRIGPAPTPSKMGMCTRVHGDFHLGQVLRTKADFVILDFEGEPARPLSERRAKESPLKDVAGMVRSFSYAAYASLMHYSSRRPEDFARLQPIADEWQKQVVQVFLHAYRQTIAGHEIVPEREADFSALLRMFLWQKVNYELLYELNNRPAWVRIPMAGMLDLMRQQSGGGTDGGS
jgi:maltose alpha-D-glucosyltransferase/alpha-amylase